MAVRQSDEEDMATFCASYPDHVEAELKFYAELDTHRQAAAVAYLAAVAGGPSSPATTSTIRRWTLTGGTTSPARSTPRLPPMPPRRSPMMAISGIKP
jgi:hypothetical protein